MQNSPSKPYHWPVRLIILFRNIYYRKRIWNRLKKQLQKKIMEILYTKSLVKPVWVTCSEIYWNIQNIKVSERSVCEALDWLVKNDVVLY